jgi:hypothetical protein
MRPLHILLSCFVLTALGLAQQAAPEYKLLATAKTSTTQKEMNEASAEGYRFAGVMGGETAFGGKEVVTIMQRHPDSAPGRYKYKLLATNRTSTMQRELQDAGDDGYEYKGQTVFETAFGGREVVVILELDREQRERPRFEYKLLATNKTSTMQKELQQSAKAGFEFVGLTVGETAAGGHEVVTILRRAPQLTTRAVPKD